jgi:hypothetical protein
LARASGVNPQVVDGIIGGLFGADPMKMNLRDLPIPWCREYDGFEAALFDLVGKKLGVRRTGCSAEPTASG